MSANSPVYTPVNAEAGAEICRLMMYIVDHPTDPPMRLVGYGMLLLVELVQSSSKRVNTSNTRLRDFYLRQATDYVDANYQNDITIEKIAAAVHLHYRMEKELLRDSQMTIKDIGASVGYENQLHFSRAFKAVYGTALSQYRRYHFHM